MNRRHFGLSVAAAVLLAQQLREAVAQSAGQPRSADTDAAWRMRDAAANLEFEEAARVRDEIHRLEANELELPGQAASANVGVAIAARLPNITLTGTAGGASSELSSLLTSGNSFWALIPIQISEHI